MFKSVLKSAGVLVSGLIFGILGLFTGAYIGGNFAESFTFNGVRGYEATGQLGFILGVTFGILLGIYILFLRLKGK